MAYRRVNTLFFVCFALVCASLLLRNGVFLALGAVFLGAYLLRRYSIPHFTLWLLIGGFLLRLAVILLLRPAPESDFAALLDAAQRLLRGDKSFQYGSYFTLWAYQTAYVCWEAMWLSLWNSAMCLKLVHILLSAGTVCLLYRMVLPYVRPASARLMSLLLTLFPFALTLPTVLTNQIPAAFFITLGLWLLVCPDAARLRFWRYPLCGAALQLGNLLRPEGLIVLVAVAAWGVFSMLREPKRLRGLLCGLLALFAVYFALGAGANALTRAAGLNANGLANLLPEWKFICGLNYETHGRYSDADFALIRDTLNAEHLPTAQTQTLCQELISQRLGASPLRLLHLMLWKIDTLWNQSGLYWAFSGTTTGAAGFEILETFDRALFYLALALAALGFWKKEGREPGACLPYFVFFAAFCAFLPIEVQPRYAYLPQLFLFTAAAFGLDRLADMWEKRKDG